MKIADLLYKLSAVLLLVVAVLVVIDVTLRYFNASHPGFRVVSRILAVWIGLFALPKVTLENENIRIEYFYNRFAPRMKRRVDILDGVAHVSIFIVLFISAVFATAAFHDRSLGILGLPALLIYAPLVVASGVVLAKYALVATTMARPRLERSLR